MSVCQKVGYRIHADKTHIFLKTATFCGRIINPDGIQYDPRNLAAIKNMPKPQVGGQLQQLLCATNGMRNSIPRYSELVSPLQQLMEKVYTLKGSRKKRSIANHSLTQLWGPDHSAAYTALKKQIALSTRLAYSKSDCTLCLFTDASERHWASILTQFPTNQLRLPIEDQAHEPLAFLSGSFNGSSSSWSVPENEGFTIVESITKLDYLTLNSTVATFTNHANPMYLYDRCGNNPGIPRHTANKLVKWILRLNCFRYVIRNLSGERNCWADMLSGWAAGPITKVSELKLNALIQAPVTPHLDNTYDWPTSNEIKNTQRLASTAPPRRFTGKNGLLQYHNGVCWIPEEDTLMKLRIMVAGHSHLGGHRGIRVTQNGIKQLFWWKSCDSDIVFCKILFTLFTNRVRRNYSKTAGSCYSWKQTK